MFGVLFLFRKSPKSKSAPFYSPIGRQESTNHTQQYSGVPQGSVQGLILFVIYVNDLSDNLTIDHLLYADDVKLIAPRKQSDALQSSLLASSKWSELILNPSNQSTTPLGILPILLHTP